MGQGEEGASCLCPTGAKEVRGRRGFSLASPDLGCQRTGLLWGGGPGSA